MTDSPWSFEWFGAAIRTAEASRWTMFKAKLFGRRVEGFDGRTRVVGHIWRDNLYMTDYQAPPSPARSE